MTELEPCPFCGGEADYGESLTGGQSWLYHIECLECGSRGGSCNTTKEAMLLWNNRTSYLMLRGASK